MVWSSCSLVTCNTNPSSGWSTRNQLMWNTSVLHPTMAIVCSSSIVAMRPMFQPPNHCTEPCIHFWPRQASPTKRLSPKNANTLKPGRTHTQPASNWTLWKTQNRTNTFSKFRCTSKVFAMHIFWWFQTVNWMRPTDTNFVSILSRCTRNEQALLMHFWYCFYSDWRLGQYTCAHSQEWHRLG